MIIYLAIFTVLLSAACSDVMGNATDKPKIEEDTVFYDVGYHGSRHESFDWTLTKSILRREQNSITSSFVVKIMLSILAEASGANTVSHRELVSVLPTLNSSDRIRNIYGKVFGSLMEKHDDYELTFCSRLFIDKHREPRQRFLAIVNSFYHTEVEAVDFQSSATANTINDWCSQETGNHIKNVVSSRDYDNAILLLISAVYYDGLWRSPFLSSDTVTQKFHLNAEKTISVPFMKQTGKFYYAEPENMDAKVLRLPYKGNEFAMYIFLPNKIDGLNTLLSKLNEDSLVLIQEEMLRKEVMVAIPKFRFDTAINLSDTLQELGLKNLFTSDISFPLMFRGQESDSQLRIPKLRQNIGIDVNEKGSTAHVAPQITLTDKFGDDDDFVADRPFLFLIENETSYTMMFTGKVVKPEY